MLGQEAWTDLRILSQSRRICCDDNVTYTIRINIHRVGWTRLVAAGEAPSLIAQGFDGCPPKAHTGSSELQGRLLGLLHHPTGRLKQECSHYMFRLIFTAHDNWSMLENSLSRPCAFPSQP